MFVLQFLAFVVLTQKFKNAWIESMFSKESLLIRMKHFGFLPRMGHVPTKRAVRSKTLFRSGIIPNVNIKNHIGAKNKRKRSFEFKAFIIHNHNSTPEHIFSPLASKYRFNLHRFKGCKSIFLSVKLQVRKWQLFNIFHSAKTNSLTLSLSNSHLPL